MLPYLTSIFAAVFVAELGDKTQLATVLFAADGKAPPVMVFIAAAAALCLSTGMAVLLGSLGTRYLQAIPLRLIAGIGFMLIGLWTVIDYFRSS